MPPTTNIGLQWKSVEHSQVGEAHSSRNLPCQDAVAAASSGDVAFVIACDGKGSARLSDVGARAALETFSSLVGHRTRKLAELLSNGHRATATRKERWRLFVQTVLVPRLQQSLVAAAARHQLPADQFEFTVSAAVVGPRHIGWLQVGDSGLVIVRGREAKLLCAPCIGRYANETCFVSADRASFTVQQGIAPIDRVNAILAFTDGVVPRFFYLPSHRPGPVFAEMADLFARGAWGHDQLRQLMQASLWSGAGGDDRSLAVLYRRKRNRIRPVGRGCI